MYMMSKKHFKHDTNDQHKKNGKYFVILHLTVAEGIPLIAFRLLDPILGAV